MMSLNDSFDEVNEGYDDDDVVVDGGDVEEQHETSS